MMQRVVQRRQQRVDVAKPQVERDAALGQNQTVAAGQGQRPLPSQFRGVCRQFRPLGVRRRQIVPPQRKFFKTDEMQTAQWRVGMLGAEDIESLPQRQKIQPGAEAGFRHYAIFTRVGEKTFGKPVAL